MLIVVTGGSGSGKSAYAEQRVTKMSDLERRYYIATMQVYDEEGRKKIQRHRDMRAGKGFITIEQPVNIEDAADKMSLSDEMEAKQDNDTGRSGTVLLECLSNLVANEMFSNDPNPLVTAVVDKVVTGIKELYRKTKHLVIVTNNVFEDGDDYEDSTLAYMEALGQINEAVAALADEVIEVVAGGLNLCKGKRTVQSSESSDVSIQGKPEVYSHMKHATANRKEASMEFYLGGACQGKLNYVQQGHKNMDHLIYDGAELATNEEEFSLQIGKSDHVLIHHFHLWIRKCLLDKANLEPMLKILKNAREDQNYIIICDEIGNGIVPMDPFEREYRERVGRIQCEIAVRAERVERIICGIGQPLK